MCDLPFLDVAGDQVAGNSADKKNHGDETGNQPCPTRRWFFQTVGTSKDTDQSWAILLGVSVSG